MTQAAIPIFSQQETFYVPRFAVFLRGQKLNAGVVDDILQVTYKDKIADIDAFDMEINNWDADQRTFKFIPPLPSYAGIFDPGAKIEVWMGYQDNMRRMMRGVITSLTPSFPESGASTLSISGLNELHTFRTEQHTYSWLDGSKTDTDIAKDLCKRPVKKGQPGLGVEIDVNPAQDEKPDAAVVMDNQYDIVFLIERAQRRGYEIYLEDEAKTPTLFFGLATDPGEAPTYRLEWGKSLISFKPTLSTANQLSSVTVRSWNRKTNKPIVQTFTLQELWKEQKKSKTEITRLTKIAEAYGNRSNTVTTEPMHDDKEAKARARALLLKTTDKLIEASASTVGLPDLRAGCTVEIIGFGVVSDADGNLSGDPSDFDGRYFVTESSHTIGNSGYRTNFSAKRVSIIDTKATKKS